MTEFTSTETHKSLIRELLREYSPNPLASADIHRILLERDVLHGRVGTPQRCLDLWANDEIWQWQDAVTKVKVYTLPHISLGSPYNRTSYDNRPSRTLRNRGDLGLLREDPDRPLESLGNSAEVPESPLPEILERFPSPMTGLEVMLKMERDEFTSLCPKTGQPDFGLVTITYNAGEHCVESKSLKLYLQAFRNTPAFGEEIVVKIFNDLTQLLTPQFLKVDIAFSPRGGISIHPSMSQDFFGVDID